MNINALRELAETYKYGQFNILEEEFSMEYYNLSNILIIKNFYNKDESSNSGTCRELAIKSLNDIKKLFPEIYVTNIYGQDDTFFNKNNGGHLFNILTTYNIANNSEETIESKIQKLKDSDAILFDPCFKKVQKFSETNYNITKIFNSNYPLKKINDTQLNKGDFVPLTYNPTNNLLTCLHNHPGYDSKIGLYFMNITDQDFCDINSYKLDLMNDKQIIQFAQIFRDKIKQVQIN